MGVLGDPAGGLEGQWEAPWGISKRFRQLVKSLKNHWFLLYFQLRWHPWATLGRIWCVHRSRSRLFGSEWALLRSPRALRGDPWALLEGPWAHLGDPCGVLRGSQGAQTGHPEVPTFHDRSGPLVFVVFPAMAANGTWGGPLEVPGVSGGSLGGPWGIWGVHEGAMGGAWGSLEQPWGSLGGPWGGSVGPRWRS